MSFKPGNTPLKSAELPQIKITGHAGSVIDSCIEKRILDRDIEILVAPFELKNETRCWQMEFWGKWMLSAVEDWNTIATPD